MAKRRSNAFPGNYSGIVGKHVITKDGYLRSRPDFSKRVLSSLQIAHLERIEQSKEYARWAISDQEMNSWYARLAEHKKGLGAWHVAIRDYYHPPELNKVSFKNFRGQAGDRIAIEAFDLYKVRSVSLCFLDSEGIVTEAGHAALNTLNLVWEYVVNRNFTISDGMKVIIQVIDVPGNIVCREIVYPFTPDKETVSDGNGELPIKKKYAKSRLRVRKV
jgi:hypothetical protein